MEKHKVHLWPEGGEWHWLHNFGATSHEGKALSRETALGAAKADLVRRSNPDGDQAEVVEIEI